MSSMVRALVSPITRPPQGPSSGDEGPVNCRAGQTVEITQNTAAASAAVSETGFSR
jgi:hypothetical protein